MPAVGEHYREAGTDHPAYRVVGTDGRVTLLRVTTPDGRRAHTGDVRHVDPDAFAADFEPASNPDAGFTPAASLRNSLQALYWNVRKFLS